jgi:glutamyl-tRNA reductase
MSSERPEFEIHLVGINHQTAPTAVREALAYSEAEAARWVELAVEKDAVDLGGPRLTEAALLCTCNRTEAYVVLSPPADSSRREDLERKLARLLCESRATVLEGETGLLYHSTGPDAARHLFRVAAGIDSMVQGEAQILGQVHGAHQLAREAGGVGPVLDRLFNTAFRAGKRSRHETEIGQGAVSVASAAVELAVKIVGSLEKRTCLVIGAGETGRLVAQHLAAQKPQHLRIANRTPEKAHDLAREVGGEGLGLDDIGGAIAQADLVVVATFAPQPLITRPMVQAARRHHSRSTVLIDISVPRNVDPAVHELDGAFVYDMDALNKIVRENMARRTAEVPKVEAILAEETEQFSRWIGSLAAGPLIAQLRDRFESLRQEEVRRHSGRLQPHEVEAVERATRGLLNKLLHGPTVHLRNGGGHDPETLELIRKIFQLDRATESRLPGALPAAPSSRGPEVEDEGLSRGAEEDISRTSPGEVP